MFQIFKKGLNDYLRVFLLFLLCLLMVLSVYASTSGIMFVNEIGVDFYFEPLGKDEPIYEVSILELLANPEKYQGDVVAITGVFFYGRDAVVFLHKIDYKYKLQSNLISIASVYTLSKDSDDSDDSDEFDMFEEFEGEYVRVIGRVSGNRALYPVYSIEAYEGKFTGTNK